MRLWILFKSYRYVCLCDQAGSLVRFRLKIPICLLWAGVQYQFSFQSAVCCVICICSMYTPAQWLVSNLGSGIPHRSIVKIFSVLFRVRYFHVQPGGDFWSSHTASLSSLFFLLLTQTFQLQRILLASLARKLRLEFLCSALHILWLPFPWRQWQEAQERKQKQRSFLQGSWDHQFLWSAKRFSFLTAVVIATAA